MEKNLKVLCFKIAIWRTLTANVRIYPYQGHGHQKESQHRYFWTDFYNQSIVGKVLFCSKRGCLYYSNRSERRRGKNSKFELGSLPSIDRDRRSRGAEFRRRLLPWQLVVLSTKCKKPPRIDSRKNELRSCSTAEEQLVSALKAPRPDFASVLSCTRGIWDAFSSLFSRFAAQWKDLSNGGFSLR